VQVQVSRVDLDGRKIDFRLVKPGDDLLLRAMRDKAGAPTEPGSRGKERKDRHRSGAKPQPGELARSPIQAIKASVKNASARKKGKEKSKASRKTRW
jgi:ribonuclease R